MDFKFALLDSVNFLNGEVSYILSQEEVGLNKITKEKYISFTHTKKKIEEDL